MAKKQTRRSISVSRGTYERLKAFCESQNISMSQFVETRVGDYLGGSKVVLTSVSVSASAVAATSLPKVPRPAMTSPARGAVSTNDDSASTKMASLAGASQAKDAAPVFRPVPMTSAAARFAVEPPPPVISKREEQPAPAPAMKTADQIFTF